MFSRNKKVIHTFNHKGKTLFDAVNMNEKELEDLFDLVVSIKKRPKITLKSQVYEELLKTVKTDDPFIWILVGSIDQYLQDGGGMREFLEDLMKAAEFSSAGKSTHISELEEFMKKKDGIKKRMVN